MKVKTLSSNGFLQLTLAICVVNLTAGCYYHRKNQTYSSAATVTPHFSSINSGILQKKCMPCHDGSGERHSFASYAGVLQYVSKGAPDASSLYVQIETGSMPIDRPMLTDDEILAVYQWIASGAPND